MRVAVVGYPMLAERQWKLCTEFERRGVDTHLVVPRQWPTIPEADQPPADVPFDVHRRRVVFGGRMARYVMLGSGRSVSRLDPDVVLTHGEPWYAVTVATQLQCSRRGVPHVVFSWENLDRVPQSSVQRAVERFTLARVDGLVAGSDTAADRLRHSGADDPIAVAPETGVDTGMFAPGVEALDPQREFEIPAGADLLLYAGRLAGEKGLETILDAVPAIRSEAPDTHILLVGEGELGGELTNRVEAEGLEDTVTVVDERQPYGRMPGLYRAADAFVYPSETTATWVEQFGYSVAEAMACGLPVVVTECGSLPYVVGEAGPVVPERDPAALGSACVELLTDESRREALGRRARKRVESEFSLEAVADDHLDLLREVAGRQ